MGAVAKARALGRPHVGVLALVSPWGRVILLSDRYFSFGPVLKKTFHMNLLLHTGSVVFVGARAGIANTFLRPTPRTCSALSRWQV